ncbi:uncharacterized protein LOC117331800 [Pecten maximus]|uniref:uncharacterized protein LOC117331800 n=1 Tax=Pecten maximus TaxID=6579 RepID=UPI001457EB51|nr:uncharacterized protein LOC117331800 [Pecten maximus]XP_033746586.1 uncharacterized protein LOC117331800 [Pecten maximus]
MGGGILQPMVILLMIIPTTTRPIPNEVPVQCGEFTCNIMREYCYHQNQCFPCSSDVCNTPDFERGKLAQCFFFCQRLQLSTSPAPPYVNNTRYLGQEEDGSPTERNATSEIRLGTVQFLLIILGISPLSVISWMLLKWCYNKHKNKQNNNNNNNNRKDSPISSPQDKHSGSTNPADSYSMLISATEGTQRPEIV